MKVKLTKDQISLIVGLGTVVGVSCYGLYLSSKEKKEFEEYKTERLKLRDIENEIEEASIGDNDGSISINDKVRLKKLLVTRKSQIETASNRRDFDRAVDDLDYILKSLQTKCGDEKKAAVLYFLDDFETKLKERAEEKARKDRMDEIAAFGKEVFSVANKCGLISATGLYSSYPRYSNVPYTIKDSNGVLKYWNEKWHTFNRV